MGEFEKTEMGQLLADREKQVSAVNHGDIQSILAERDHWKEQYLTLKTENERLKKALVDKQWG